VVNALEVGGNQQVMIEVIIAEMQRNLGRRLTTNWNAAVRAGQKLFTFDNLLGNLVALDQRTVTGGLPPSVLTELSFSDRIDLVGTFINVLRVQLLHRARNRARPGQGPGQAHSAGPERSVGELPRGW
jgi:Flp pilus assembly secretin CpaC